MTKRENFKGYLLLALVVLIWRLATALPIERAGYMDASYTLHVAGRLAAGQGLTETVLWNYLDEPTGLPHPSNLYWLPLPTFLTAGSYAIFGESYRAAQLPFILLSLFPPLFAYYLAFRISGRSAYAWMAGLLTAFSGFYTLYWISPDNFTTYAVTADLSLFLGAVAIERMGQRGATAAWFAAGIFAGLSQLSRADAFLLVTAAPLAALVMLRLPREALRGAVMAAAAFLLVTVPWFARNLIVAGSPIAPGGARTLWLIRYDELFRLDVQALTLERYLGWGWANIAGSKLGALGYDLLVLIGAFQVFLAPLAVIGLWQWRRCREIQVTVAYLVLLLAAMAFIFTLPGRRGSMLHSTAALIPLLSVAVPPGLDAAIRWVARRRRQWNESSARLFFRTATVALAVVLSAFVYSQGIMNLTGASPASPLWNDRDREFAAVGQELDRLGVPAGQPVMTVDPPSFANDTGRWAIAIPTESIAAILEAAARFDANYLVLQDDHPLTLEAAYKEGAPVEGLDVVRTWKDAAGRPVTLMRVRH